MRRASQFETRLRGIESMIGGTESAKRVDSDALSCELLRARWQASNMPSTIAIRAGFLRRMDPLTVDELQGVTLDDRKRPDLPRRPPLSTLVEKPKGVALALALTCLFLTQTSKRPSSLLPPVQASRPNELNLADLLARRAVHDEGSSIAADASVNHARQVMTAVRSLMDLELLKKVSGRGPNTIELRLMSEAPNRGGPLSYKRTQADEEVVHVPVQFWLNGWVHALSSREIGCWLMFRDLLERYGPQGPPKRDGSSGGGLQICGADRLREYDLTRACWDAHQMLTDFGLMTYFADPNRLESGLVVDFQSRKLDLEAHRFTFTDEGLHNRAVQTVEDKLRSWGQRNKVLLDGQPQEFAFWNGEPPAAKRTEPL